MLIVQRRRVAVSYSTAAQAFISSVEAADGQSLETAVKNAYAAFIDGLITDGLLGTSAGVISQANSVIKAACIMAGARTLSGALVPLVGPAPTNNNFVSGDYDRKTGLAGNGSSKYLNTNRNNNADPQNSNHASIYVTAAATNGPSQYPFYIGSGYNNVGSTQIGRFDNNGNLFTRNRSSAFDSSTAHVTGFLGIARSLSSSYVTRFASTNKTITQSSDGMYNGNFFVFWSNGATSADYSNGRIAWYSVGESLTLTTLQSRVDTLMTALAAAIP